MKLLRKTIRKIIFESSAEEWANSPEGIEFKKYHDRDRAIAAIQELSSIFKDAYSFDVGSWSNQFTVNEMNYEPEPGCIVRIRIYRMHGALTLDEIETTPECEGKGYAREAIQIVKDVAKKHRILVRLEAKAFNTHKGEGRMSSADLEKWYASQGFVKKGWKMEYKW
jgi:GNAT superfamily N-acetyltransferase